MPSSDETHEYQNEHGYCPHCFISLDGGDIRQTFIKQGKSPKEASRIADAYGYRPGHTQWGRAIGMSDPIRDRITEFMCPECGGRWPT